jgi:hypothetical protein
VCFAIFGYVLPGKGLNAEVRMEYAQNGSLAKVFNSVIDGSVLSFSNPTGIATVICGSILGM